MASAAGHPQLLQLYQCPALCYSPNQLCQDGVANISIRRHPNGETDQTKHDPDGEAQHYDQPHVLSIVRSRGIDLVRIGRKAKVVFLVVGLSPC